MTLDWEGCKKNNVAKKIAPDKGKIMSLIESANDREKTADMLPINNITKETVVSLYYDVLREYLEALSISSGYKIYNHECYTSFLRVVIKNDGFATSYDSIRMLRNSINYYGKKIYINDANRIINTIKEMILKGKFLLENRST